MTEKTEGTLVLDGLLEGKLPDLPDAEDRLRQWVRLTGSLHLRLHLQIDGDAFSILAENTAVETGPLGPEPAERIADAIAQLVKQFPEHQRTSVFSTLRSTEYRRNSEVQTLYIIQPDGTVETRQRTVDAATVSPPRQLTGRDKARLIAYGLGVAVVILALSAFFVDYRALFHQVRDAVLPFDAAQVKVETTTFAPYLTVQGQIARDRNFVVTLKRTAAYPAKPDQLQKLFAAAGDSLPARLTLEALATGYVRCEYFGSKDEYLGFAPMRISPLADKDTVELPLPLPTDRRLTRIRITY